MVLEVGTAGFATPLVIGVAATVAEVGLVATRVGDKTTCGAVISQGSANVLIGGPTGTFLNIQSEIPFSVRWVVLIATIAISLGSAAREIGAMLAAINEIGLARALQTGVDCGPF